MNKRPKIVVLTGAGISAESGIRTFRAADGLWENHKVDEVATPEGFLRNPALVQNFYNERRQKLFDPAVKPNAAHTALVKLEQAIGDNFLLVTQNVDNLHERAGSKNLIHMHGDLLTVRCEWSGKTYHWERDVTDKDHCDCCSPPRRLRPHIVWFGEMPLEMERIYAALSECDYFIAIGTSGNVYPAAGFVQEANRFGAKTVELNLEPSLTRSRFSRQRYGKATKIVPIFVDELLTELS